MNQISAKNRIINAFSLKYIGYSLANVLSRYLRITIYSLRWIEPGDVSRMLEKMPATYTRKSLTTSTTGDKETLDHVLWNALLIVNREWQINYASFIERTANTEWVDRQANAVPTEPDPFRSDPERRRLLSGRTAR